MQPLSHPRHVFNAMFGSLLLSAADFKPKHSDLNRSISKPKPGALATLNEQLQRATPGSARYKKIAARIRKNGGRVNDVVQTKL